MKGWVIFALCFLACGRPADAPPADVLPRERFTAVLLEAQLIEARMHHELVVAHFTTIPGDRYYADMFKAQGTDKEQFQRSFNYWSGRPEEMKAIYEDVLNELSRRRDGQAH